MDKVACSDAADLSGDPIETCQIGYETQPAHGAMTESETGLFRQWRGQLTDESGQSFADFRAGLRPRYYWVWVQAALAYMGLIFAGLLLVSASAADLPWWQSAIVAALLGLFIGYLVAFLALWLHEAAHYNVHSDREWNDRLATFFFGVIIMHHVCQYRQIHLRHHRNFGKPSDPEQSYFSTLNVRFIVESLTGLRVLRVLLARSRTGSTRQASTPESVDYYNWALPAGVVLHASIVLGSLYFQYYTLALAWSFGVFVAYPFFGAIRQALEHRRPDADPSCDYKEKAHGQYTRVFGRGVFASTFGGAGFNRHLIHHWDPGISCTCFDEVEQFLLESQLHDFYVSRQISYRATLTLLMTEQARSQASNG